MESAVTTHDRTGNRMTARNGLTYADSRVDIDAGNRLVDNQADGARHCSRGADAEIGGVRRIVRSEGRQFHGSVLVAATERWHKGQDRHRTGHHGGIGIDLVAMSVGDLIVRGRRSSSSTISDAAKLTSGRGGNYRCRNSRGLSESVVR